MRKILNAFSLKMEAVWWALPLSGALLLVLLSIGIFMILSTYAQKSALSVKIEELSQEKKTVEKQLESLRGVIYDKEKALDLANRQNFQQDLLNAKEALRSATERLGLAIKERADLENRNAVLDSRLKNTTQELTRSLDELRKARQTLGGIEAQYQDKFKQLNDAVSPKDEEIKQLAARLTEKDTSSEILKRQEKDYSDALRKHQAQVSELEDTVSSLKKAVLDKERALAQREEELKKYYKMTPSQRDAQQKTAAEARKESLLLERQISESSAKIFEQNEQIKDLEDKLGRLQGKFAEREEAFTQRDRELRNRSQELEALRLELRGMPPRGAYVSTAAVSSDKVKELELEVQRLENEKQRLSYRLETMEKSDRGRIVTRDTADEKSYRLLSDRLARKEEEISQLESELKDLKRDKSLREKGTGFDEKKFKEMEILVTALTKNLGEYAALIQQKDKELRENKIKISNLAQDARAQKAAAIALQRELSVLKSRQQKTYKGLSEILTVSVPESEGGAAGDESIQDYDQDVSSDDVQKRTEELKKRVEVLLEER
ncbi:MAG TPA: hypothetical protein DCL35_05445 [Candidatus Omnitrophica bacterium]|nr:hypothetical protein [Candidatus Omnitrophota bacterium]